MRQSRRQFGFQRGDELAAGRNRSARSATATDEHDARGEGISADTNGTGSAFSPNRPSTTDSESGFNHCGQESIPAGIRGAVSIVAFRLFKRIVNSDWKCRVSVHGETMHCLPHAIEKEFLSFLPTTVTVWGRHKLLGLWYGEGTEKLRENLS